VRVIRSAGLRGRDRVAVEAAITRWLARQRTAPDLVGASVAARILGVQPPYISRLREMGRMPEAVPIEGSQADGYVRGEVEALARELAAARRARRERREERV
jgi:hypothetical protein